MFQQIIKKAPLPVAGVGFGATGLGGLLAKFGLGWGAEVVAAIVGLAFLSIVAIKAIAYRTQFAENLENPVQAAVLPVFFLAFTLIAGYLSPFAPGFAYGLWTVASIGYAIYVAWFVWRYIVHFDLKNVFAAFFIPFVGVSVPSMTSAHFAPEPLRIALFWIAFVLFIGIFVVITWRYLTIDVPEHAEPVFAVYAAPISMLLVVLSRLVDQAGVAPWFYTAIAVASQVVFLVVLLRVPRFLKNGFYPSYAALTFPFIITAMGALESLPILHSYGFFTHPVFTWIAYAEAVFAVVMTVYVIVRFFGFLAGMAKPEPTAPDAQPAQAH